jgi:hypothetical protein
VAVAAQAVFCDDIRIENNAKYLLIGVYDGELSMNNGPGTIALSIYLQFFGLSKGDHKMEVSIYKRDDGAQSEIGIAKGDMSLEKDRRCMAIPVPGLPVHLDRPCVIYADVSIDGAPPIPAGQLEVVTNFPAPKVKKTARVRQ